MVEMSVPPDVPRNRQSDLPVIDPRLHRLLEEDILRRGVVIPVVVAQDGEVIDGRLRREIARRHGLDCPTVVVSKLAPEERADLRLAVNVYRRHLTQAQLREIVGWELRSRPEASDRSIASKAGVNHRTVAGVRRELEATGEILRLTARTGTNGKRYPARPKPAVYTAGEGQARIVARKLESLGEAAPDRNLNPRELRQLVHREKVRARSESTVGELPANITIVQGDLRTYDWDPCEGKASLVIADPPWGTSDLTEDLAGVCARLLEPSGTLALYCGQSTMPAWIAALSRHLTYQWTIASLNTHEGKVRPHGVNGVPILNSWRPILIFSKGPLRCERMMSDVLRAAASKDAHPWEQPVEESLALVQTFCPPGGLCVDPAIGSGTSMVAVQQAGSGRRGFGLDIDDLAVSTACRRVAEAESCS